MQETSILEGNTILQLLKLLQNTDLGQTSFPGQICRYYYSTLSSPTKLDGGSYSSKCQKTTYVL